MRSLRAVFVPCVSTFRRVFAALLGSLLENAFSVCISRKFESFNLSNCYCTHTVTPDATEF